MSVRDYIFKIGNGLVHLTSGLLVVDGIRNIYQGNYEIAALEGLATVYLQISERLERQRHKTIENFAHRAETELIPAIEQTKEEIQREFQLAIKSLRGE